jgi:ribosomal protein S20
MPITSSAKKALKRSEKLQERNLKFKSSMKSEIKKIKKEVEKVSK